MKSKLSVRDSCAYFFIMWLGFLTPAYLDQFLITHYVTRGFFYISCLVIFLFFIKEGRIHKLSSAAMLCIAFFLEIFIVTIFRNSVYITYCFKYILPVLAVIVLFETANHRKRKGMISTAFWYHLIVLIINFLTVIFSEMVFIMGAQMKRIISWDIIILLLNFFCQELSML